MSPTIPPLSAAAHYAAGMQFWESRAKSLQALVDVQDQRIRELEALHAASLPDQPTQSETDPAAE